MIQNFLQFLVSLPPTSQAAIIASLVTLTGAVFAAFAAFLGAYIAHRGNERRFAKQLEHERQRNRV